MSSGIARNEPCSCGSGRKHKDCCARRRTPSPWLALVSAALFALATVWIVAGVVQRAATEPPPQAGQAENPGEAQPPGPPPPGMVWSAEHGHWHEAPAAVPVPPPAGPPPPGKVWSTEHGHWHDADQPAVEPPAPAAPETAAPEPEAGSDVPLTNDAEAVSEPGEP